MNILEWWYLHPAEWWQFWFPQSGPIGGGIASLIILGIVMLVLWPQG